MTIVNDVVEKPSYKTMLIDFVRLYMSEEGCKVVYEVLSYLYEKMMKI